jgi:hypothetical protein
MGQAAWATPDWDNATDGGVEAGLNRKNPTFPAKAGTQIPGGWGGRDL